MVKQSAKKFRKNSSAGKHQTNWLWGQQSVMETLQAGRWRVYELFVTEEVMTQNAALLRSKQKDGVELEIVSSAKLAELSQTTDHQGIVARVSKYPYETLEALVSGIRIRLESSAADVLLPLVVLVDRVQDAFHFASILRSSECAGVMAVVIGEHCQAQVTTQVARASMGVVNHLVIVQAANLVEAAAQLKATGLTLIATDSKPEGDVASSSLNGPCALMIGSDAHGLDPALAELCDRRVRFPVHGKSNTLPIAVAAGIVLYEIRRQQRC
jgi:23S rRNA (guanosine2251-2'-O)-methyltransferase